MLNVPDQRFLNRANAYIDLANSQLKEVPADRVLASLVDAAARFYVFTLSNNAKSGEELLAGREEALAVFERESRGMIERHLMDYARNYETFTKNDPAK